MTLKEFKIQYALGAATIDDVSDNADCLMWLTEVEDSDVKFEAFARLLLLYSVEGDKAFE